MIVKVILQIKSIVLGGVFLTQIEMEGALNRHLSEKAIEYLTSNPEIILFHFYGRKYYKWTRLILLL